MAESITEQRPEKTKQGRLPKGTNEMQAVPFDSVEEAWFWFIQARLATTQGARIKAGAGKLPRPCEPYDILMIVNDLYRKRRLLIDHAKVLRHYGERLSPPNPWNVREGRAFRLWQEAMQRLEPVLWRRGIIACPVMYMKEGAE